MKPLDIYFDLCDKHLMELDSSKIVEMAMEKYAHEYHQAMMSIKPQPKVCHVCEGSGRINNTGGTACYNCNGSGIIWV